MKINRISSKQYLIISMLVASFMALVIFNSFSLMASEMNPNQSHSSSAYDRLRKVAGHLNVIKHLNVNKHLKTGTVEFKLQYGIGNAEERPMKIFWVKERRLLDKIIKKHPEVKKWRYFLRANRCICDKEFCGCELGTKIDRGFNTIKMEPFSMPGYLREILILEKKIVEMNRTGKVRLD